MSKSRARGLRHRCFGLAVSVIDEDQQEVEIEMREKGHSSAEIASALEVARAAENILRRVYEGFGESMPRAK